MIHIKDHKTPEMFDRFPFLGPKRKQRIEASWAKIFRELILPTLPVEKVFSKYDPVMGAPTKELYAMLGLMVIQQMHNLTDEEAVDQFAYNLQWHYALNITSTDDANAYVSPKTLWTMRNVLTERNIYEDIFNDVTKKLAEVFSVDVSKQRFDSVHIFSNMRHLGRIGLFVKTIKKFLVNLKRHHKDLYEALDKALSDRYMTKQGESVFSMVKPSESTKTLTSLATDVFTLVECFRGNEPVVSMTSYQFLVRLLKEQCILERVDTHTTQVSAKANKDVLSDSLQNPSDPDAGYNGYKGQGYQMQIADSHDTSENADSLNLITGITVKPVIRRNAHALVPLIETTTEPGLKPKDALVDTLYGGDENCRNAETLGVEIVSPVKGTGSKVTAQTTQFTMNSESDVTSCQQDVHRNIPEARITITLRPFQREPVAAVSKRKHVRRNSAKEDALRYDDKTLRLARRRA